MVGEKASSKKGMLSRSIKSFFGRYRGEINRYTGLIIIKLSSILLILLLLKLFMIGTGFYAARHLMGDARAINFAGSERMRAFKIGLLLENWLDDLNPRPAAEADATLETAREEVERFEEVLYGLRDGAPAYGLRGVRDEGVLERLDTAIETWNREMKPLLMRIMNAPSREEAEALLKQYKRRVYGFVHEIDAAVSLYEEYSNWKVRLFDLFQYLFLSLTILFTLLATCLLVRFIRRPLRVVHDAISKVTSGDFKVRIDIRSNDEIGDIAYGFNYMVERLEDLYKNLEERVALKTRALREKNRALSMLYEIASSTSTSLPLTEQLDRLLSKLTGFFDARAGAVRILDRQRGELRLIARKGLSGEFIRREGAISLRDCTCGVSVEERRTITLNHEPSTGDCVKRCGLEGFASMTVVPLKYQNQILGAFNLYFDSHRTFNGEEFYLLESIGNHLGMVIENMKLQNQALKLAAIEERVLIANELHDSIAQSLAFLKIQGRLLEESLRTGKLRQAEADLMQMQRGIEESNRNVRDLLVHFRTRIEPEGLVRTLEKYLERFREETGIETVFEVGPTHPPLSSESEVHVLHIIQEALSNVRKYAGASMVRVSIEGNGCFKAVVEDNGRGFDPSRIENNGSSHIGIEIMHERANRLRGELSIESAPGRGTRVELRVSNGEDKGPDNR